MIDRCDLVCTCMRFDPDELVRRWRARARPITRRQLMRGRPVDPRALASIVALIYETSRGGDPALAEANWGRSHHLLDCPCSSRRAPAATVDFATEAAWASRR